MAISDNLPAFIMNIAELSDLARAEQEQLDRLSLACQAMLREMFIDTFTEKTAHVWEDFFGLEHLPGVDIEHRRERVRGRMFMQTPLTPAVFKQIVEDLTGAKVLITEDTDNMRILIKYVDVAGISPYMIIAENEIEKIRPFHLPVVYEYSYVKVEAYTDFTSDDLSGATVYEMAAGTPLWR